MTAANQRVRMPSPADHLAGRARIVAEITALPADASDADVDTLADAVTEFERAILTLDHGRPGALAAKLRLTVLLWEEGAPLIPAVRDVLEYLAIDAERGRYGPMHGRSAA